MRGCKIWNNTGYRSGIKILRESDSDRGVFSLKKKGGGGGVLAMKMLELKGDKIAP